MCFSVENLRNSTPNSSTNDLYHHLKTTSEDLRFSLKVWLRHRLGLPDIEWFALEMNQDHPVVFEIAPKYCVLNCFVDYEGYSIPSKGFLPTVVDIYI